MSDEFMDTVHLVALKDNRIFDLQRKKIKISREQARAIEYGLNEFELYKNRKDQLLGGHWICIISDGDESWAEELKPLNGLTFDQLAIALYVGYEVEINLCSETNEPPSP